MNGRQHLLALVLLQLAPPLAAVEPDVGMPHHEHRTLLVDFPELEWRDGEHGDGIGWEGGISWGGDVNRVVLASEGSRTDGVTDEHELHLFWQRAWHANWAWELGVREDAQPGNPSVAWASAGVAGLAPGFVDTRVTFYASEYEQGELRLELRKEVLFTQRTRLETEIETSLYRRDAPRQGVASGLATTELALRLRHELSREFVPYLGVTWQFLHGDTARLHDDDHERALVAGFGFWF